MGLIRKEDLHETLLNSLSNPNLLINGDFQVWQRGTSFNYDSANNFNIYTADRWRLIQGGTGSTAKVIKTSEIEENTLTIMEFTKPSGIEMALSQKLDYPLQKEDGKNYTLSVSYSSNLNAELCIREYDPNIDIGSVPMPSSTNINTVSLTFNSSKLSKKNNRVEIYIRFSSEETYNNSAINLSNIKLEIGSSATVFSSRPYGEELVLCQRYYEITDLDDMFVGVRELNGSFLVPYNFKVKKRAIPTIKIGHSSYGDNKMYLLTKTRGEETSIIVRTVDKNHVRIYVDTQDDVDSCAFCGWIKADAEIY